LADLLESGCPSVPEELDITWQRISRELRAQVPDFTFHIWLEPLRLVSRRGRTLYIGAPQHIRTWVSELHLGTLRTAAARTLGEGTDVEIVPADFQPPAESAPVATETRFNPRYTFGQFVIGDENHLAHAAALTVAELPAQAYNPLFIHGPPGLGKTHLLHAIGNYVERYSDGLQVRYATVEEFTSDFVGALRRHDIDAFRHRFRDVDVLLLDDVQFLADKLKTKEELFHTFNALYESGAQLVLTSDRSPADLTAFETRLSERFASGLVAELIPPGISLRLAILRWRARQDGIEGISEEVLAEVARRVASSVRALEGALIRVVAYASLNDDEPTPELARRLLSRLEPAATRGRYSLDRVQELTASAFGITREALLARNRRPQLALARQVAMYLARELTDEGLPAIGRAFGGRSHATVLHAHRKVEASLPSDAAVRAAVDRVRRELTADA
jgi:chromosomal replication initiator protein